ncbi:3-hydroxybutyryl-CoA dehydrogenase [Anaerobacterium chartisolvens]|uniref:3-hydroxybutyryl-CoA dehydrogenase n=1 Tax=Anaerobacterium chartisolvens TaxID=1297424 RepID=A0A369BA14_9FIRM|nr:3-hydroxyacyl-CoA dehydrogenase NAD-binding domain-containing protein [Anaerobacterium chartisolvens]RCX18362.1 3-hydroxybutyryl-CoA dehydrogenase [Anaerobacterium chartisolvens]
MNNKTVGVIGAGTIGSGVAQDLAQNGIKTIVVDVSQAALDTARNKIRQNIRLYKLYNKTKPIGNADEIMELLTFTTDYKELEEASFVIENITENWEAKKEVYKRIDEICPENTMFAVNSSCISITRVGSVTKRPSQILGMHFMNPVPIKPVVEVIRGFHTSAETIKAAEELLKHMQKEAIIINDMPGFVSNRLMTFMINEAAFLVQEQVAAVEDIDRLIKTSYGHKMGPLETADLIGVDTILYSMEVLYESFNDSKFRPCPLLKKMVDAGQLGRKSGKGFYTYSKELIY